MTAVDWIIVVVLAAAMLGGFLQGFVRAIFTVGGLLAGLIVAAWNYRTLGDMFNRAMLNMRIADTYAISLTVAFLVIALLITLLGGLLGSIFSRILHKMGLGCVDKIAGAAFGLLEGAVLVTVGIVVTVAFYPKEPWLTQSRLPKYFFQACHLSTHVTPNDLSTQIQDQLDKLEESAPSWLRQSGPSH